MATRIQLSSPVQVGPFEQDGKKKSSDLTSKVTQTEHSKGGLAPLGPLLENGDKGPPSVQSPGKGPGKQPPPAWLRKGGDDLFEGAPTASPHDHYAD